MMIAETNHRTLLVFERSCDHGCVTMKTRTMRRARSGLILPWVWLGIVGSAQAQGETQTRSGGAATPAATQLAPAPAPSSARPLFTNRPEDERAIQSVAAAYARAYNAGDAPSLAALFTDDAEIVGETRDRLRTRAMIEQVFSSMFQQRPGAVITIAPASLRFFSPDVAQEEGQTVVKIANGEPPLSHHYSAILVKQGNRWMYSSVREEPESSLSHHQRLRELEWLVGDWLDESPDSVVHSTCRWTEDQNFLIRDFTVRVQGKSVMSVSERIGWDPSTRQIKSWVFDSEGGFGCGQWSRTGNEWVIKSTGIMPDGRTATATHILTRVNPQTARWSSVERTVGDQVVPDRAEYVMVRRPPQPQAR
jgi:uncharacterized protein (TIGR02246 family)